LGFTSNARPEVARRTGADGDGRQDVVAGCRGWDEWEYDGVEHGDGTGVPSRVDSLKDTVPPAVTGHTTRPAAAAFIITPLPSSVQPDRATLREPCRSITSPSWGPGGCPELE